MLTSAPIVLLALAVCFFGSTKGMAGEGDLTEKQRAGLEKLGGKSFAKRQAATQALMRGPRLNDATMRTMLNEVDTAEQLHRLLQIAKHQTIRRFRRRNYEVAQQGAVGVRHHAVPLSQRPDDKGAAVIVIDTIVGFPGHSHFEPGDAIVAINGQPVPDTVDDRHFKQRIPQFQRGESVRFTVVRRGERKKIKLTLAGTDALREATQPRQVGGLPSLSGPFSLTWRQRRERLLEGVNHTTSIEMQ